MASAQPLLPSSMDEEDVLESVDAQVRAITQKAEADRKMLAQQKLVEGVVAALGRSRGEAGGCGSGSDFGDISRGCMTRVLFDKRNAAGMPAGWPAGLHAQQASRPAGRSTEAQTHGSNDQFLMSGSHKLTPDVTLEELESSGVEVAVAFKCSPLPGGLAPDVVLAVTSYVSNILQVVALFRGRTWITACLVTFFVAVTAIVQCHHVRPWQLPGCVRISTECGVVHPEFCIWISAIPSMKNSFTGMLALYGLLNKPYLGTWPAISGAVFFLLAIHSLAQENISTHSGDKLRQFGKAAVRKIEAEIGPGTMGLTKLEVWSYSHLAFEVVSNVLLAYMYHPLVPIALYVPMAVAIMYNSESHERYLNIIMACASPLNLMTFSESSILGLRVRNNSGKTVGGKPAWPSCLAHVLRLVVMTCLFVFDTSGSQVFLHQVTNRSMSKGSAMIRCFILLVFVLTLFPHLFFMHCVCRHPLLESWRRGGEPSPAHWRMRALVQRCGWPQQRCEVDDEAGSKRPAASSRSSKLMQMMRGFAPK